MLVNIGRGLEMEVGFDALPQAVKDHVVYIGLRNVLMDAHAGAAKLAGEGASAEAVRETARAMADKKLASMVAGIVRTAKEGGSRETDPVMAEAKKMAEGALRAKIKAAGKKWTDYAKDSLAAAIAKLAATEEIMAKAQEAVAAHKGLEIDMDDLGL